MLKHQIIEKWSILEMPLHRDYLIINALTKLYNKNTNSNLINLYKIDAKYNTFFWYINENDGNIFNIKLKTNIIDDNYDKILKELNIKNFIQIVYEIDSLKRSERFNIINIITIQELNKCPEYFKVLDYNINKITASTNKRKRSEKIKKNNKKIKITNKIIIKLNIKKKINNDINWSEMVSASSTRNFLLNDPLIDWLEEYNIKSINDVPCNNNLDTKYKFIDIFTQNIMEEGNKFEGIVIKKIRDKHDVITISETYQSKNIKLYKKTKKYMKKGVPIIYQGILHNYKNKTYGSPDLLVRSDYLNKFIGYDIYNEKHFSKKLNVPWHYVVVDIKHSQIELKSNGETIRNSSSIPAYKGQLLIYMQALNEILGCKMGKAFIMGRKYKYKSKNELYEINDYMSKLGIIDYKNDDKKYIKRLNKALSWLRLVKSDGHKWKLLPSPSHNNLFPNMKNDATGELGKIKKELAIRYGEITSVYYCGIEQRKLAFKQGIYSWHDPKCITKNIFEQTIYSSKLKHIDTLLKINRQKEFSIIPKKIKLNEPQWRERKNNEFEFFIDYETLTSNINDNNIDVVFMIGIGYENNKGNWIYKSFIMNNLDDKTEEQNFNIFWDYIKCVVKENKKKIPVFVHWSNAEKTIYDKILVKYNHLPHMALIDLYDIFIKEPIIIYGVLKYSLKDVAKALYKQNIVKTIWNDTSDCSNGLTAMLLAFECYTKNKLVTNDIKIMKEIESYNEVDCKTIWEIITYLRNNH